MKHRGCTAWVQVHPTKEPDYKGIRFCEDRPSAAWIGGWKWQRVVVSFDEHDHPFAEKRVSTHEAPAFDW